MKLIPLRDFLSRGARWTCLGGFAAYALMEVRKQKRLQGNPDCIRLFTCADCVEYGGCVKPKAEAFRKEVTIEDDHLHGQTNSQPTPGRIHSETADATTRPA